MKNERVEEDEIEISILHLVRLESRAFEDWKKQNVNSKASSFNELSDRDQTFVLKNLYHVHVDSIDLKDSGDWVVSSQNDGGSFRSLRWIKLIKYIDVRSLENGNHKVRIKINLDSAREFQRERA